VFPGGSPSLRLLSLFHSLRHPPQCLYGGSDFQNVFQLSQSLLTLLPVEAIFVEPEIGSTITIFEFIPPASFQNFYDSFANDKSSGFSESYESDYSLTGGMWDRDKM